MLLERDFFSHHLPRSSPRLIIFAFEQHAAVDRECFGYESRPWQAAGGHCPQQVLLKQGQSTQHPVTGLHRGHVDNCSTCFESIASRIASVQRITGGKWMLGREWTP
ncbi:hypothetical protein ES703_55064 [subsurface metagenome]